MVIVGYTTLITFLDKHLVEIFANLRLYVKCTS